VYPGRIIFELSGVNEQIAKQALLKAGSKLPFHVSIISRVEL
jgi:large subunit ribosomal protein L16